MLKIIVPIVFAAGAFAIGIELFKKKLERKFRDKYGEAPEARINRLANNLQEATKTITEIESELKDGHTLAEKVKSDYERYSKLASLKEEEVNHYGSQQALI